MCSVLCQTRVSVWLNKDLIAYSNSPSIHTPTASPQYSQEDVITGLLKVHKTHEDLIGKQPWHPQQAWKDKELVHSSMTRTEYAMFLLNPRFDKQFEPPFQHFGIHFPRKTERCNNPIFREHPPVLKMCTTNLVCHSRSTTTRQHWKGLSIKTAQQCLEPSATQGESKQMAFVLVWKGVPLQQKQNIFGPSPHGSDSSKNTIYHCLRVYVNELSVPQQPDTQRR